LPKIAEVARTADKKAGAKAGLFAALPQLEISAR
jgi:hypothetical protein